MRNEMWKWLFAHRTVMFARRSSISPGSPSNTATVLLCRYTQLQRTLQFRREEPTVMQRLLLLRERWNNHFSPFEEPDSSPRLPNSNNKNNNCEYPDSSLQQVPRHCKKKRNGGENIFSLCIQTRAPHFLCRDLKVNNNFQAGKVLWLLSQLLVNQTLLLSFVMESSSSLLMEWADPAPATHRIVTPPEPGKTNGPG